MMKTFMMRLFLILVLFMVPVGCQSSSKSVPMRLGGKLIQLEFADTPEARKTGLQNRKKLPQDRGMLFLFPVSQYLSFWSKDTYIALSLAFLDDQGKIVKIVNLAPESTEKVISQSQVRYALEMNAGWFEKNGVSVGDRLIMDR